MISSQCKLRERIKGELLNHKRENVDDQNDR